MSDSVRHRLWLPGLSVPPQCGCLRSGLGERWKNALQLIGVAALTAAAMAFVLIVPWATGSVVSPLKAQQVRQAGKSIGALASYGDIADLAWPNGSRTDEVLTWPGLVIFGIGLSLALCSAIAVRERTAVFGLVSSAVWMVLTNLSLAQMFGQYLGMVFPYVSLAAGSGLVWGIRVLRDRMGGEAHIVVAATVVALGVLATVNAYDEVVRKHERQISSHQDIREIGFAIDRHYDGECGVITSYSPQVGWYSGCQVVTFGRAVGDLEKNLPGRVIMLDSVSGPDRAVAVVIVDRGKRQPKGEELELLETLLIDEIAVVDGKN